MGETIVPVTFRPDMEVDDVEHTDRLHFLAETLFDLAKNSKLSEAEKGAVFGRAVCHFLEPKEKRADSIQQFRDLCDAAEKKYNIDMKPYKAGFMGEIACADLLSECQQIECVSYPKTKEDIRQSTDWKAKVGERSLHIQTKTMPYIFDREDDNENIPIFHHIGTIKDLNDFMNSIRKLSVDFVIVVSNNGKLTHKDELSQDDFGYKTDITFSIAPDKEKIPQIADGRRETNRLEEVCLSAVKMYKMFAEDEKTVPVMCLMGSPEFSGSDINTRTAMPSQSAKEQGRKDLEKIIDSIN